MRDALEEAYARGLPRPWLLVATCINGYTFVCRYAEPSLGGGLEPEMFGEVISNSGSVATSASRRPRRSSILIHIGINDLRKGCVQLFHEATTGA